VIFWLPWLEGSTSQSESLGVFMSVSRLTMAGEVGFWFTEDEDEWVGIFIVLENL